MYRRSSDVLVSAVGRAFATTQSAAPTEDSRRRVRPWQFTKEFSGKDRDQSRRFNDRTTWNGLGNPVAALEAAKKLKKEGVQPSRDVYNGLLRSLGGGGYFEEAWAVLQDMKAMGVKPNNSTYTSLLHVSAPFLSQIGQRLKRTFRPVVSSHPISFSKF